MSLIIPTLSEIKAQIITDIEGAIGQTSPIFPKAFVRVTAAALAGLQWLCYRFAVWCYHQIFTATADEAAVLARGAQYGLAPTVAVAAKLEAEATGDNDTTIEAGTLWYAGDMVYSQTEAEIIAGGIATIEIECLTAGEDGNLENGETVSLASPITGVNNDATITDTVITGEDAESLESFRLQVQERERRRPQGGAIADYVEWALEVPGIIKAFAHRLTAGYATIYPMIALIGTLGERIPDAPKLAEVEAYLSDAVRKPLQCTPIAAAMTEIVFDITITDLSPDTAAIRAAIETELESYLLARYPKQYPDETIPVDVVSIAALSGVVVAAGMQSGILTMEVDSTPESNEYTLQPGELAILGSVIWV